MVDVCISSTTTAAAVVAAAVASFCLGVGGGMASRGQGEGFRDRAVEVVVFGEPRCHAVEELEVRRVAGWVPGW